MLFLEELDLIVKFMLFFFCLIIAIPLIGLMAVNMDTQSVSGSGLVYYGDFKLNIDRLDWGRLVPGEIKSANVSYTATNDLRFNVTYSNYVPVEFQNYSNISYEIIDKTFIFTLTISEDIRDITAFSFDVTITEIE